MTVAALLVRVLPLVGFRALPYGAAAALVAAVAVVHFVVPFPPRRAKGAMPALSKLFKLYFHKFTKGQFGAVLAGSSTIDTSSHVWGKMKQTRTLTLPAHTATAAAASQHVAASTVLAMVDEFSTHAVGAFDTTKRAGVSVTLNAACHKSPKAGDTVSFETTVQKAGRT